MFTVKPFSMDDNNQINYADIPTHCPTIEAVYDTATKVDTAEVYYGDMKAGVIFFGDVAWTSNFFNSNPDVVKYVEARSAR